MSRCWKRWLRFVSDEIWRTPVEDYTGLRRFVYRQIRVVVLALSEYHKNRCFERAAVLTIYVLFSVIPLLAISFGVAKGFGFDEALTQQLRDFFSEKGMLAQAIPEALPAPSPPDALVFSDSPTSDTLTSGTVALMDTDAGTTSAVNLESVIDSFIDQAKDVLEGASGNLIAGVGIIILLWSIFKALDGLERSFNDLWGVSRGRTYLRKFTDYLALSAVAPPLIAATSSLNLYMGRLLTNEMGLRSLLESIPAAGLLLRIAMCLPIWVLFTFMYMLIPNARTAFKPAVWSGFIAAVIFQIAQVAYMEFQVSVAQQSPIYGSFAALPLFLLWLQISWSIVFLGAELCVAYQTVDEYADRYRTRRISHHLKRLLAVRIVQICGERFIHEKEPPTKHEIAEQIGIPDCMCRTLLYELLDARLLIVATRGPNDGPKRYMPAAPVTVMTIQNIVDRYEARGLNQWPLKRNPELEKIVECFDEFRNMSLASTANLTIPEIADTASLIEYEPAGGSTP